MSRKTLTYFLPTKNWVRRQNPQTKKEIIAWYRENKKMLENRLRGPVKTTIEVIVVEVDKETREIVKKAKKSKNYPIEKHKLTKQDYEVYSRMLEKRFQELKKDFNKRLRNEKKDS